MRGVRTLFAAFMTVAGLGAAQHAAANHLWYSHDSGEFGVMTPFVMVDGTRLTFTAHSRGSICVYPPGNQPICRSGGDEAGLMLLERPGADPVLIPLTCVESSATIGDGLFWAQGSAGAHRYMIQLELGDTGGVAVDTPTGGPCDAGGVPQQFLASRLPLGLGVSVTVRAEHH